MFTHEPLQLVVDDGQLLAHAPPVHTAVVHGFVQLPQCATSVWRSTQLVPQAVSPVPHVHVPAVHVDPVEHAVPHAPQCAGSDCMSTHVPPQSVRPGSHAHVPPVQV